MKPLTFILFASSLEPTAEVVDFKTALLLIFAAGIGCLLKVVYDQNRRLQQFENIKPPSESVSAATIVPCASNQADELSAEILAVIAAAVSTSLNGQPHRIVAIKPELQTWSLEGRRQIFLSHAPR